ncbi:hypothetical protein DIZ81_02620 [Legionella taurinensis]|uniref:Uncharacterized protein n=1 Tax=Legionella taurinensis TaxID=70611 RepID=A0AB38N741_9GAMM|nr:hypothetical protein [Legionella taurinensis]MDX1836233.1 hypothetical protein [Legionella taurinensis]PUT42007.1 hypothetical protein DB744_02625 [Legionella taurinensis]PUT44794.1 hypothetical protein DB746_02625 [Legionella taurinensis]PUT48115.1 hypothetical protein DB743_00785 [Legionella taurinensis]PUT48929.1 hypothetical protein DB745_02625 [Legionella taurinensis]
MQQKSEAKSQVKRIKLEPPFNAGDCGYYAFFTGILYLVLASQNEDSLEKTLNESLVLSDILQSMETNIFSSNENVNTLRKMLDAMASKDWDRISYNELLNDFSNALRNALMHSSWGRDYFTRVIQEGAWSVNHGDWNTLPSFKKLEHRVFDRMSEIAGNRAVGVEEAGEIRFKATLEVCQSLKENELEKMADEVIKCHYGPGSKKAWVDRGFLEFLCQTLFASSTLLFNEKGVEITSKGTSDSHWYLDLPDDEESTLLLNTANKGYTRDLRVIERFIVRDKSVEMLHDKKETLKDLLKVQEKNLDEFKATLRTVQAQMKSASEEVLALGYFETEPPDEPTITAALLPFLADEESLLPGYTSLVVISKSISESQSKIESLKEEIKIMKKTQASQTTRLTGFFATTSIKSDTLKGSGNTPDYS